MENETKELKPIQFIQELCKGKPVNELLEAEQNFREFLLVIKEIADCLESEGKTLADFDE
jgi:hypothetical protein